MRKNLGRYVVVDTKICHGQPTFRGTRIFVKDVLDQVAAGTSWDEIITEWHGSITYAAIAEAVQLAAEAFLKQAEESAGMSVTLESPSLTIVPRWIEPPSQSPTVHPHGIPMLNALSAAHRS